MESSQTTKLPVAPPPHLIAAPSPEFQHCDECGAPVDHDQRYCVSCGAHRRHVPDPAARYLGQASARRRAMASAAVARTAGPARRGAGLLAALVIALIPVAAVIGVEVGRTSNDQDSRLIKELATQRAQTVQSSTPVGSKASKASTASTGTTKTSHKKGGKATKKKSSTKSGGGKVVANTANGSVTQVAGSKVSSGQAAQGASEAKTIESSTGKNYVQAANNLPSQVVP